MRNCARPTLFPLLFLAATAAHPHFATAQAKAEAAPDVLVLANGDTLHGKLVKEVTGSVTFHTADLGDVSVPWKQIKELHAGERFGVLDKNLKLHGKKSLDQSPSGSLDVANQSITIHSESGPTPAPVPVADAQYIVDYGTLDTQINHQPGFLTGWNGSATAGATLVEASQNQYTVAGALAVMRMVPSLSWLTPRNRTSADFSGSYGKITQPGAPSVKSSIYHIDAERDQYISSRLFGLGEVAFDHNYAQDLQLQQIYGGGLGWTLFSTPRQEADIKATIQYEKQQFISGGAGSNQNLIGSTFSADYMLHLKLFTFVQTLAYIPAYNTPRAYSANETDSLAFPAYKNLGFSVGTMDSYLNDLPAVVPPTKRNSFQFTMGLTYAIKSKY
jgi:hypothetical protein